jgi:glycosyltransferase involved in cell wall biosynthesis
VISNAVFNYVKINREIGKNMFDRVQLVYYGFAKVRFNSSRELDHSRVLKIGTISRLEKQKDLETLMRAVASLSPDTPICLKILGDGSQRDNLESLSKELSINEFTHFLGKTDQVNDFLFSIDVFVLTSKYEGFGAVLVEAMQAGVPIIATRASSIPEVLGDHYPGLCEVGNYKEVANLILKSKTPSFTEICISGYEERLVKFSEDLMVQNLLCVYNEALAR